MTNLKHFHYKEKPLALAVIDPSHLNTPDSGKLPTCFLCIDLPNLYLTLVESYTFVIGFFYLECYFQGSCTGITRDLFVTGLPLYKHTTSCCWCGF